MKINTDINWYNRIGEENIRKLIHEFYIGVKDDQVLKPMYPEDLEGAELRLFYFMVQYLGGPAIYTEKRGHPRLRMRHMVFPVNEKAHDAWLGNMKNALGKIDIDKESYDFLWNYFVETASFLRNR